MRIIDADKFKKQIAGMAIVNGYSAQKVNKMCELIDEQPTAYDVDAVVEQLKTDSSVRLYGSGNSNNYLIPLEKAIKIVKAGEKYV